jgi:hypothetical protein
MASDGSPAGIVPTVATPWSSSENAAPTAVAVPTARRAPGARGSHRRQARMTARVATATARVVSDAASRWVTNSRTRAKGVSASTGTAVNLASWLVMSVRPTPVR